MKQDKRPAGAAVKKRRFFNRISRKLMLFVVLMSMVLLALVWLLSVKLLEPMYNRRVLADLNHAADVYSAIIEKYGKFESFDKSGGVHIPSDMMEEIMDNRGLLAGKCFEVAGTDCKVLLHLHQLQSDQCLLHPNPLSQLMEYSEPQWNSTAAVNLRATTFVLGDLNFTLPDSRILPGLESTSGTRQMVVCRNINNQYSLILSTDLERVGQAADVISAQMPIIAAVLLIVSIAGAYVFSRWFTKPISAISRAAREMARGNYKVRVTPQADDELGALAGDFNTMAREVGRTSELQRDLIANVSHDLRTPLTLIKGYAETVRDLTGDNKEKRDEQLSVMRYNVADAAISMVLVYLLLPVLGIKGYILVIVLSEVFNFSLSLGRLIRVAKFEVDITERVVKPLLCAAISVLAARILSRAGLPLPGALRRRRSRRRGA